MQDIKTLYKISQTLGKALQQVNDICAHYLADKAMDQEKPAVAQHVNKVKVSSKSKPAESKSIHHKEQNHKIKHKEPQHLNFADRLDGLKNKQIQSVQVKPKAEQVKSSKASEDGKKVPHADRPKQPLTAFFLFQQDQKENFKKIHPELGVTELSKSLGQVWKSLTQAQQKPYIDQYEKAKVQYNKKLQKFYQKHPEQKSKKQLKKQKAERRKQSEQIKQSVSSPKVRKQADKSTKKVVVVAESSEQDQI